MKPQYIELLKRALCRCKKEQQILMAIEEMSELTKELLKNINRDAKNEDLIAEELADVYIMLAQVEMIYNISDESMYQVLDKKTARLKQWLDNFDTKGE